MKEHDHENQIPYLRFCNCFGFGCSRICTNGTYYTGTYYTGANHTGTYYTGANYASTYYTGTNHASTYYTGTNHASTYYASSYCQSHCICERPSG